MKLWSGADFNGFSAWRGEEKAHDPQKAVRRAWRTEVRTSRAGRRRQEAFYREVMSLRALSSSSLMALYFSFWAYNSSGGQRSTGSSIRCQEQQEQGKREAEEGGEEGREGRRRQTFVRFSVGNKEAEIWLVCGSSAVLRVCGSAPTLQCVCGSTPNAGHPSTTCRGSLDCSEVHTGLDALWETNNSCLFTGFWIESFYTFGRQGTLSPLKRNISSVSLRKQPNQGATTNVFSECLASQTGIIFSIKEATTTTQ